MNTELPDELIAETPLENSAENSASAVLSSEEEINLLKTQLEEAKQAVLYAQADIQNARKRTFEETAKARKFAVESFASELLAVKDSLEMALLDNSGVESLRAGVELTLKQLSAAFEKANVVEINPQGEKLDPNKHQAISTLENEAEANTVLHVMQKGYSLAERLLRPAMVVVSAPKA